MGRSAVAVRRANGRVVTIAVTAMTSLRRRRGELLREHP